VVERRKNLPLLEESLTPEPPAAPPRREHLERHFLVVLVV